MSETSNRVNHLQHRFQLLTPDLTYTLVKPLEDKYARFQREGNLSIVFCLLLNRVHFTRDQSFSTMALSKTRADLCEILAIRATRFHADDMLEVTTVLTTSWPLFAGASAEVIKRAEQEEDMDVDDSVGNALEMAILGKAKRFIKSSPCQNVIDGIWRCETYRGKNYISNEILAENVFIKRIVHILYFQMYVCFPVCFNINLSICRPINAPRFTFIIRIQPPFWTITD